MWHYGIPVIRKALSLEYCRRFFFFTQVMLDDYPVHEEFPTIEHENKDLLEYKVAYSVRIGRPRMIRSEELWTQAGQWLIAEQIKEQNLLVMQWGALR